MMKSLRETWEKNVLNKHLYRAVLNIVCFETFSEKRKENELHGKHTLFGVLQETISSYNFTDLTKFMILFHLPWLGAKSKILVCEFLKNKNFKRKLNFFLQKNAFFAYCFFVLHVFTGKRSNIQKAVCDGLGNSISYKMMSGSKTVGGDTFLVPKVYFSGGGG